jgi:hypothetical protein
MSNTSDARKARRKAARVAARNPQQATTERTVPHIDPLGDMARQELARISEEEEMAALSGDGKDLWNDIENIFRQCAMGLVQFLRSIADMNDRSVLVHMRAPQQFIDRVTIFKADVKRFEAELNAIHALHAHRANDNTGNRETLAAMEISEHYSAWQAKASTILDKTMMELTAMFDEARRIKLTQEAEAAAVQDVNVVTDVEVKDVVPARGQTSVFTPIDELGVIKNELTPISTLIENPDFKQAINAPIGAVMAVDFADGQDQSVSVHNPNFAPVEADTSTQE